MSLSRPPKIVKSVDALIATKHECTSHQHVHHRLSKNHYSLGRAKHLMSKGLRILAIRPLGLTTALAQTPRKIGGGESASEIKIGCRFGYVRRDVEIGRFVRGERVLRRIDGGMLLLLLLG